MWYASRATGVVSLLLLTAVMLLGLLVTRQGRLPGLPRFAVTGLHRNLSLLAVAFVALHVLTAVADGYVNIPLTAAVVPLASSYERLWLGLGAVSLDLMLAADRDQPAAPSPVQAGLAGGSPLCLPELAGRLGPLVLRQRRPAARAALPPRARLCAIAVVGRARLAAGGRRPRRAAGRAGRPADDRRARPDKPEPGDGRLAK